MAVANNKVEQQEIAEIKNNNQPFWVFVFCFIVFTAIMWCTYRGYVGWLKDIRAAAQNAAKTDTTKVLHKPQYDGIYVRRRDNLPFLVSLRLNHHFDSKVFDSESSKYMDIITECCKIYNLDKKLVLALITLESGWEHNAVSKKKAVGLMQVMSGSKIPSENIKSGCSILRNNLDYFDGDVLMAVTAYNTGIYRAKKIGKPIRFAHKVVRMWIFLEYYLGGN